MSLESGFILFLVVLSYIILIPIIKIILRKNIIQLYSNRITTIDGLRGYLAINVFVHHYIIIYYWHINNIWTSPPIQWVNNIGQVSVALFFMITGYLFFKKILDNKFVIRDFFIGRFFRLVPLYYFLLFFMYTIIFVQSNFEFNTVTIKELFHWLFFLQTKIGNFEDTYKITASVTWTLRYEWFFYMSLPIFLYLSIQSKVIMYIVFLLISYFAINEIKFSIFDIIQFNSLYFLLFLIGFTIAKIEKYTYLKKFNFDNFIFSVTNSIIFLSVLFLFETGYGVIQFILLGIFFMLVVLKNTLFGLLVLPYSRVLGEISYSIYLLHGIIMYVIFSIYVVDFNTIKNVYLGLMPIILLSIVCISIATYLFLEYPMIKLGKKIQNYGKK